MKYPQLVSTRAVNAISDWLVSQLEQLGVEAPLIYSRLLLSLLHSSVQINDPIEFNNLETFLSNRKGTKRNPPCDTDTLKKITAVQCLMDTVSSEQEITKIENLVEELCDKLNDIENNQNKEEDMRESPNKLNKNEIEIEDPRKRYYRAFPALSKEMDDSAQTKKYNIKALTWPNENSLITNTTSNNSLNTNTSGVKRKSKRRRHQGITKGKIGNIRKNSYSGTNSSPAWDTDFEGSWEMGHDLIKDFLIKQNNRNRSTSESGAYNICSEINFEKRMKPMTVGDNERNLNLITDLDNKTMNYNIPKSLGNCDHNDSLSVSEVSISNNAGVISDEGYSTNNDALTSLSEVDNTLNKPRRLYKRDDSLNLHSSSDFAQFKAKFNSSVEALWKNNDNENSANTIDENETLVSVLPMKHENLNDFWENYYNHRYDSAKLKNDTDLNKDEADEPDSFPTTSGNLKFSSKVDLKKDSSKSFAPVAIFWQNSIWSDNSDKNLEENDDSINENMLNSYKNEAQIENNFHVANEPTYFNISKWSECSFETPFVPPASTLEKSSNNNLHLIKNSKNDPNELTKTSFFYNYKQQPIFSSNQTVFKKSTKNQQQSISLGLSDLDGEIASGGNLKTNSMGKTNNIPSNQKPLVTLKNHSENSKFVEYSQIKSIHKDNFNKSDTQLSIKEENSNESCALLSLLHMSFMSSPISNISSNCDEENLLVSDRTHFRPIKQTYADGYEFDIPNNLDEVKFERSESGFLYLESEKYLEYSKLDTNYSDEEVNSLSHKSEINKSSKSKKNNKFSLKFRVKQNEKYCQTGSLTMNDYVITTQGRDINNRKSNDFKTTSVNNELLNCEKFLINKGVKNVLNKENKINKMNLGCYSKILTSDFEKSENINNVLNSVWEMDFVHNNIENSNEANRLLKDELNKEADEIMSDLKYMQNLYIDSDWESENDNEDSKDYNENELYKRFNILNKDKNKINKAEKVEKFSNTIKTENPYRTNENLLEIIELKNSNKDQLREESRHKTLNNNKNEEKKNDMINIEKYVDELWSNVENIIWKEEVKQPIGNGNKMISEMGENSTEVSSFFENLNWKHSNLAQIWQNMSVTSSELSSSPSKRICFNNDDIMFEGLGKEIEIDENYCVSDEEMNDNNIDGFEENNSNNSFNEANNINKTKKDVNIIKFVNDIWSNNEEKSTKKENDEKNSQLNFRSSGISSYFEDLNWKHSNLADIWKNSSGSSLSEMFCKNEKNNNDITTTKVKFVMDEEGTDNVVDNYSSNKRAINNKELNNAESIIWKKESGQTIKVNSKISSFFENLNWEHSNLAEIWDKNSKTNNNRIQITNNNNNNEKLILDNSEKTINLPKSNEHFNNIQNNLIESTLEKFPLEKYENSISITNAFANKSDENHNNHYIIKKKVTNRKRRHSASQSIQDTKTTENYKNNCNCNEKNNNVLNDDLVNKTVEDFCFNNNPTTIITCKYWATTASSIEENNEKDFLIKSDINYNKKDNDLSYYDGVPTLALNASSILKQVVVVTRPLTR